MAIESYFFNAIKEGETYDRVYNAEDLTNYLNLIVSNGVFPNPSTNLQVIAGTGMNIIVKAGSAWINGHKGINTADLILPISASDVTLNRIDIVVIRVNKTTRLIEIVVKEGTKASTPVAPTIQRDENIYELCLGKVYVGKQVTSITQSVITDTRLDTSVCGVTAVLIDQIDTETLFAQYQTAFEDDRIYNQKVFDDWFQHVKENLSTTALMREFKHTEQVTEPDQTVFEIGIPQYIAETDILTVYLNGMRLSEDEYTNTQSNVILKNAIDYDADVTNELEFVVYKSVDGADAETVVEQVEDLQPRVTSLESGAKSEYVYKCNGIDDNRKLSELAQDFLTGSGDYAGIASTAQMTILVEGTLGIDTVAAGSGSAEEPFHWMVLGKYKDENTDVDSTGSQRKITFDFSNAQRISLDSTAGQMTVAIGGDAVNIIGLQMVLGGEGSTLQWFNGQNVNALRCELWLNANDIAVGSSQGGSFEKCRLLCTSMNDKAYTLVSNGTTPLKAVDCEILSYNGTSASEESICVLAEASKTESVVIVERCNIPVRERGGYKQSQTIKIDSGYASIISNMLGKAAVKYDEAKCYEAGTMLISK